LTYSTLLTAVAEELNLPACLIILVVIAQKHFTAMVPNRGPQSFFGGQWPLYA